MSAGGDHAGDFLEMGLHGIGVGAWHDEGGALGLGHGAEEIGALVALVLGLSGLGSLARPLAHRAFFWPRRISSWNQISTGVALGRRLTFAATCRGKFF